MLTHEEAAAILGVHPATVHRMIVRGELTPRAPLRSAQLELTEVERLAVRRAVRGRALSPYFMTAREVAATLGIVRQRVDQLAAADRLPYVETGQTSPRRLYRRAQIAVIAAGRAKRRGSR